MALARKIAGGFIQIDPIVLQLYGELDQHCNLSNTSAGRFLVGEIADIKIKDPELMEGLSAENEGDDWRSEIEDEREITQCAVRNTRVISGETK